ncbi:G- coupled receptor 157-like [Paramuricea clavata]|uniref:G- coupled receptor 157-like n=1 Tax=Paramuricea clavata TaxID=317549 RepID=A0A6S7ICC2_PARCT|nr:G- coupled receptor 157-like [Paramuricea clavata]
MALYLHAVSVKANYELGKRIIFAFHRIAWPVPLLISLIALLAGKLGGGCAGRDIATAKWCWIKENCDNGTITTPRYESVLWMLLAGKLWEITSYILIIIVYARIYVYVRKQRKLVEDQSNSMAVARFRAVEMRTVLIPGFFILIRIWGTLQFLIFAFSGDKSTRVLTYFQACGDGAQGFVNAILFCLIADKLKLFFKKCFNREGGERESLLPKNKSVQNSAEKQPSNPI